MLGKIKSLFSGGEKVPCRACEGTGQSVCHHCGGSGLLSIPNRTIDCPHCGKTGKMTCATCRGTGRVKKN